MNNEAALQKWYSGLEYLAHVLFKDDPALGPFERYYLANLDIFGAELWLCAWMEAAPHLAWVDGKQFALCELRNVLGIWIPETIYDTLYDEQYGFSGRYHNFPVGK